jgi:hypothetical protein
VTGINMCANYIHNRDCIDCCIGNNKQILDALSYNKNFKVCIQETLDIMDAFFRVIPMPKKYHPSLKTIFLAQEQMMREKLYSSLNKPFQKHLLASWEESFQNQFDNIFPSQDKIISAPLPLQSTLPHEPIKKKYKPGIDHDNSLLRCIHFLTKVDWSITDGFDDVPLLPSNKNFQALENLIGPEKPFDPLLHFLGLLPYIMKSQTQNDCSLRRKYREYPPASWPHAFSCANKCQNKYSKVRREDKCSSIIYIAESCIPFNDCNPDFLKWVKNQPGIYILDEDEEGHKFQFVPSEKMHRYYTPLP